MKAKYLFFVPLFFLYLGSQAQTASRLIVFANRASALDSVIYIYNTYSRGNHILPEFDPSTINAIIPSSHIDVGYGAEVSASEPGIIQYDTAYTYSVYGRLVPRVRGYHEFDSHNNITSFTNQIFDSVAGWQNDTRDLYTYDSDQHVTQQLFQPWDGSSWQNYRLNAYSYSTDHIDTATVRIWDNTAHAWRNSKHTIYLYDAENRLINIVFGTWDNTSSYWTDNTRWVNHYDVNGDIDTLLIEDKVGSHWLANYKHVFKFNSHHQEVLYKDYSYYRLSYQDSFIYDAPGNLIKTMYYADSAGVMKYTGMDSTQYNGDNQPRHYTSNFYPSKVFYYETYIPAYIPKTNANTAIKVYPNPVQNTLNITGSKLEHAKFTLADVMGKTVATCILKKIGITCINVSYLPPGIYWYQATIGGAIIGAGKVVKE